MTKWRVDADSTQSLTAAASLADLVERVVRESGLEASLDKIGTEEDLERLQNLEELVSAAADFEMPLNHHAGGATPDFGSYFPASLAVFMIEVTWWSQRALWHFLQHRQKELGDRMQ